ncbi:hypothetical protein GN244_ATG20090 [Phytophthora infestans]|uniref:DUF3730 domain-containing protein n=1 Tax=Phytophthora infestans TaxID=4787 RepID=A0A833SHM7_PHYIN|nr:hypothetical protein GN244_ATG20090 [Phytophthora infestans]
MVTTTPTLAALLKGLRQVSPDSSASRAMEQAADRLISTSSLAEAQNLVFALQNCAKDHHSAGLTGRFYDKLQQAAAICTEPSSKAEFLGFTLFQESVHLLDTLEVSTLRRVLFKVLNANMGVLSGYLAALTSVNGPICNFQVDIATVQRTLEIISPVFKTVLMDTLQTEGHKAAVLNSIVSIAWRFEDNSSVRTALVRILVDALELVPHSQLSQATYASHVSLVVELLRSFTAPTKEQAALATRTARFVLESVQLLLESDVGVVSLLQALGQLARQVPKALWCSVFLASAAYFLVDKCETPLEQQLMLHVLKDTLEFGCATLADRRSVYVETLLLPLSSLAAVHGSTASELLQKVIAIKTKSKYHVNHASERDAALTATAVHARSAVQLIGDAEGCQRWLNTLFSTDDAASTTANKSTDKWLALVLSALLSDTRSCVRKCAAECLTRQVKSSPKVWGAETTKALVSSLVFLVSQHPATDLKPASARRYGLWMTSCLYSLAGLAATTTDTMRVILRLLDSMNNTTKMRPMALQLMYEVWQKETRVFPRLETMLLESTCPDDDTERHVVRMATIKALCEEDPELGVQFIAAIQAFLEDKLQSVVAMAMDAITALCGADCLDFYVAFKIISQKMRKNKVTCADETLFQERLCCFYALGGAESRANEKHAVKLLHQTWEFADSEHLTVRKAAYAAMCTFPLDLLGLCMSDMEQESEDEEQATEEEVEEQVENLLQRLEGEQEAAVRTELETLVARVIEYESAKLTAGVGRGQRVASAAQASVSAAATKEMKALLPSRAEVQSSMSEIVDWSGFLLAYQPKAVIDTRNVKRKDKLVRLATQNVDELMETVASALQAMELPWTVTDTATDCELFLRTQVLMEGWRGFMATYVTSLDELAQLKTPVGVDDADVGFRVFSEGAGGLFDALLHGNNKIGGAVAAGALAGQLWESRHWQNPQLRLKYEEIVEELTRLLALSMEKSRVLSTDDGDARSSSIGALIALQLALEACALLGLSHVAALYSNGEELETLAEAQWRQRRVKPIAERILESFLYTKQQRSSSSCHGDVVFPLDNSGASASIDKVAADLQRISSSDMLLSWAASMGLARLATVALGPVLLHCVHFNVAPSSSLETFVATCIQRAADNVDSGFVMIAAAFVLCRLDSFGGFPSTIQEQTTSVVKQIQRALEDGRGAVRSLALSAVANLFHLSFGISGSFVPGMLHMEHNVELTLDNETIAKLVKSVRVENERKKSFDVEIRTLPSTSLLVKTLEWLRQTNPSDSEADTKTAMSLLGCLTSTGTVLPLLDYASLTRRVMFRFCSVDTSVACVRFAATQASCDELVAGDLLSSRWFGHADAALQAELTTWIAHAATRVSTDVLRGLLTTIFDILKDIWRRDTSSSTSILLFDSWTAMLRNILEANSTRRVPESSVAMVNHVILQKIVVEIPFGPHASSLVRQFASRVLSKVDYGERGCADSFLMPTKSNSSDWSWWRSGLFIVTLAKLNALKLTKREASLAFQWILRHDFDEWTDDKLVELYLQPLIAEVGALIAQHTRPAETVSCLLDVIDAFSRGLSALDASVHKRRALFDVMSYVLSWKSAWSHERYLLALADVDTAAELLPFGYIACAHNSKTVSTLGERLLALLQQMNDVTVDETRKYVVALDSCSRQMYVAADRWYITSTTAAEIRDWWSLKKTT